MTSKSDMRQRRSVECAVSRSGRTHPPCLLQELYGPRYVGPHRSRRDEQFVRGRLGVAPCVRKFVTGCGRQDGRDELIQLPTPFGQGLSRVAPAVQHVNPLVDGSEMFGNLHVRAIRNGANRPMLGRRATVA